jgi:hypothetical protein
VLSDAGVPAPDIEAYLTVLGDRPALDAAMNWYRDRWRRSLPH